MLMIRFQRIGRANDPAFRIAVLEKERAAQANAIVEQLGTYNPRTKALTLDVEAAKAWLNKGAQPTDSIRNLFIAKGVMEGKKVNVLPKKTPIKSEAALAAEKAAAEAAAAPAVEAMPTEAEVVAEVEPAADASPEAPAPEEASAETAA